MVDLVVCFRWSGPWHPAAARWRPGETLLNTTTTTTTTNNNNNNNT